MDARIWEIFLVLALLTLIGPVGVYSATCQCTCSARAINPLLDGGGDTEFVKADMDDACLASTSNIDVTEGRNLTMEEINERKKKTCEEMDNLDKKTAPEKDGKTKEELQQEFNEKNGLNPARKEPVSDSQCKHCSSYCFLNNWKKRQEVCNEEGLQIDHQFKVLNGTCYCCKKYNDNDFRRMSTSRRNQGLQRSLDGVENFAIASDWMEHLPDDVELFELTIPGTHDTMTYAFDNILTNGQVTQLAFITLGVALLTALLITPVFFFITLILVPLIILRTLKIAKCQDFDLEAQLNFGVRALDIRCKLDENWEGEIKLFHGLIPLSTNLDDVFRTVRKFLAVNSKETILMSIKDEHSIDNPDLAPKVESFIERNKDIVYQRRDHFPRLGQVRGKIFLLRRELSGSWGTHWGFVKDYLQDKYDARPSEKLDLVLESMRNATDDTGPNLHINFLSSNRKFWQTPGEIAAIVNPVFTEHMLQYSTMYAKLGIVFMDYPLPAQLTILILMNYRDIGITVLLYDEPCRNTRGSWAIFQIPDTKLIKKNCTDLQSFDRRTSSLQTTASCLLLWTGKGCTGEKKKILDPSECSYNLELCEFDNRASSMSSCRYAPN